MKRDRSATYYADDMSTNQNQVSWHFNSCVKICIIKLTIKGMERKSFISHKIIINQRHYWLKVFNHTSLYQRHLNVSYIYKNITIYITLEKHFENYSFRTLVTFTFLDSLEHLESENFILDYRVKGVT